MEIFMSITSIPTKLPRDSVDDDATERNVLRIPLPTTLGDRGYNALKLAEILGMSSQEIAQYLDCSNVALRKNPEGKKIQPGLIALVTLADMVIISESLEYLRRWLRAPNMAMMYRVPINRLIIEHKEGAESMIEQIHSVLSGQGQ